MATDLERLVVQLSAEMKGFEKALNKANGVANSRARAIENRFRRMNTTINAGFGTLANGAMRAFAVIGGAQGFRTLSDSATRITNSLKVAGLEGEALDGVYQKLLVSAQKNAAPLEALVELYGRASLVQKELGVSSEQLISFTDNIAVALRASGKSSQEASGALLQLSQALGSGVVRAEEFNSIQEGAPTILQAAAAGIKQAEGSVAKLRKIMLDGGLSSKAFFDGISAGAPLLEQKLSGAVLTIDQRFENLKTSLVDAARRFNESTKAADTFGAEIDRVASFVNGLDFDSIIAEIQRIADQFNVAIKAANNFATEMGKLSGLEWVGEKFVEMLPGEGASKSFFGGALTVSSSKGITDRINQAFEHEIQKSGELTAEAIRNSVLAKGDIANGGRAGRIEAAPTVTPIDLDQSQYKVTEKSSKGSKGGSKKSETDSFEREVQQIKQRTAAIQAETAALANRNPLFEDYGYALERARAKQELLNAAQQAGVKITPELAKSIESLAEGYANAVVASEKLAEKQDQIRQRAEEAMATAKDVTRGMIDGLIEGSSAADILANSLKKIGNALIDDVLNNIFKVNNAAGGGGFLSSLFGGFGSLFGGGGASAFAGLSGGLFANGGYTGNGGKYQPAGVVHKGEYVFDQAAVKAAGGPAALEAMRRNIKGYANGGAVGVSVPTLPKLSTPSAPTTVTIPIKIDATGADAAGLERVERQLAKLQQTLPNTIIKTVQSGKKGRML